MSPKLPKPPSLAEIAAKQGDDIDSRYHPSAAVRRQLNKVFPTHWSFLLGEIALYSFIILLITGVYLTLFFDPSMAEVTYHGVYQPLRRHRDVEGLRVHVGHQLRDPRRPVRASGSPLGRTAFRRGDHGAPGPHLLHRRVPPSPRDKLGDRLAAADPRDVRGLLRLLAARRPALRHRRAGRALVDHTGHAGDRQLAALGIVRWRLPLRRTRIPVLGRRRDHPPHVRPAHSADPGDHPCAHRCAPRDAVVPEAHGLPGAGQDRDERRRCPRHADLRRQVGSVLRDHHRHSRPDGRPDADQPDLATRPLQTVACVGGQPARLLHDVDGRPGPYLAGLGVLSVRPHHPRGRLGRGPHGARSSSC